MSDKSTRWVRLFEKHARQCLRGLLEWRAGSATYRELWEFTITTVVIDETLRVSVAGSAPATIGATVESLVNRCTDHLSQHEKAGGGAAKEMDFRLTLYESDNVSHDESFRLSNPVMDDSDDTGSSVGLTDAQMNQQIMRAGLARAIDGNASLLRAFGDSSRASETARATRESAANEYLQRALEINQVQMACLIDVMELRQKAALEAGKSWLDTEGGKLIAAGAAQCLPDAFGLVREGLAAGRRALKKSFGGSDE